MLIVASSTAGANAPVLAAAGPSHPEEGLPLLRNYQPVETGAGTQNWNVLQSPRGFLYAANNEGVLEYDGVSWRSISLPHQGMARSLALDAEGRIWVGGLGDFGRLEADTHGRLRFVSFRERLPEEARSFEDVWRILPTPEGVWIQVTDRLFLLEHEGEARIFDFSSRYRIASFLVDGDVYVQRRENGLFRWSPDDRSWPLVDESPEVRQSPVDAMLALDEGILVGTRDRGLHVLDSAGRLEPWPNEADDYFRTQNLYRGRELPTGELAFATLNGGVVLLDRSGRLLRILDRSSGLRNEAVYDVAPDFRGGLLLGLANGLARVETPSPISIFDERSGFADLAYEMVRHDGKLWIAHDQGLGFVEPAPSPRESARFRTLTRLDGQTRLAVVHGRLLAGSSIGSRFGVWEIRDGKAEMVRPSPGHSSKLLPSRRDPLRVWIGVDGELASIRLEDGTWRDEGAIPGIDHSVKSLAEDSRGRLWFETDRLGLVRLEPASPNGTLRFFDDPRLPRGTVSVFEVAGEPVLATTRGLVRYDEETDEFEPDERFGEKFVEPERRILHVADDGAGGAWISTATDGRVELDRAVRRTDGTYALADTPLERIFHLLPADSEGRLLVDPDGVVWISATRGLIRYDPTIRWPEPPRWSAAVRRVVVEGIGEIHGGSADRPWTEAVPHLPPEPSLRIEVAAPAFEHEPALRFQSFLVGLEDDWSSWTRESSREFTRLREGSYRFRIRARDLLGRVSREDEFRFQVRAPWHRTGWAISAYLLLGLAVVLGVSRWNGRRLVREARRLEELVERRTAELIEANRQLEEAAMTDPLTSLPNRRSFVERAENEIRRHRRTGRPWACLVADIDGFKMLNDTHGHHAGDDVLRLVADVVHGTVREIDLVARWGGEELVLLLPETEPAAALRIAERIRARVAESKTRHADRDLSVTLTVGVCADGTGLELDEAIRRADEALYAGKRAGRDRVVTWNDDRAPG